MKIILVVLVSLFAGSAAGVQQPASPDPGKCPMHDARSPMNQRAEKGMGFSQTATTHHFLLRSDGGVIQVGARDSAHITRAFQNGDFDVPMFVHDTVPPGVPAMKRLQKQIHYSFQETPNGGRVVISSTDKDAVKAVHSFLRFQIKEHTTGDATEVR